MPVSDARRTRFWRAQKRPGAAWVSFGAARCSSDGARRVCRGPPGWHKAAPAGGKVV